MQQLHSIGFPVNIPKNNNTFYISYVTLIYHIWKHFLQAKLRYLGLEEHMICLDKLRQSYALEDLNIKEIHLSKVNKNMMTYQITK